MMRFRSCIQGQGLWNRHNQCTKSCVTCLSSEAYNDLVILGDDRGGRIDVSVEEGLVFAV